MNPHVPLPPGQHAIAHFPRFGRAKSLRETPEALAHPTLVVDGRVSEPSVLALDELRGLPRVHVAADFHCVATWSHTGIEWSGVRLRDFYARFVAPYALPDTRWLTFWGADRWRAGLAKDDALAMELLIADRLDGRPLGPDHGAPLRLVAPDRYGYKSVKRLCRIELLARQRDYRPPVPAFMEHPRARVAREERGRVVPGWLLRRVYRLGLRIGFREPMRAPQRGEGVDGAERAEGGAA